MTFCVHLRLKNLADTKALGLKLGSLLPGGHLLALTGDLGAGKTTLTQSIALGLGLSQKVRIQSPTYTLLKTYTGGRLTLNHLDFYRLSHVDELIELGFEDLAAPDALTVVEWANRFPDALPDNAIHLNMTWLDPDARHLELSIGPTPSTVTDPKSLQETIQVVNDAIAQAGLVAMEAP